MKRVFIISIFLLVAAVIKVSAQNYVDVHKDEIIKLMSQEHRNFKLNKNVINRNYNYLKYEDNISEQTILFFLSDDDYCTMVRWLSSYANIHDLLSMLNKEYNKTDKNQWTYIKNGKKYVIHLEEGEWFFTVNFKLRCK